MKKNSETPKFIPMKHMLIVLLFGLIMFSSCNNEPTKYLEEEAIAAFDQMSSTIGELQSCSYTLTVNSVRTNGELSQIVHDVYMRGPDKMYVYSTGDNLSRGYWYNGTQFAYFDFINSTFDTLPAPENIILAIDAIHEKYGIYFPAADFFYPTFTDDMIDNFDSIYYVKEETIGEVSFIDILGVNTKLEVFFTLSKNEMGMLPFGLSIINKAEEDKLVYDAVISNWRSNPNLPDKLFNFQPVENATRIKLELKKQN